MSDKHTPLVVDASLAAPPKKRSTTIIVNKKHNNSRDVVHAALTTSTISTIPPTHSYWGNSDNQSLTPSLSTSGKFRRSTFLSTEPGDEPAAVMGSKLRLSMSCDPEVLSNTPNNRGRFDSEILMHGTLGTPPLSKQMSFGGRDLLKQQNMKVGNRSQKDLLSASPLGSPITSPTGRKTRSASIGGSHAMHDNPAGVMHDVHDAQPPGMELSSERRACSASTAGASISAAGFSILRAAATALANNPNDINLCIALGMHYLNPVIVPSPRKSDLQCAAALLQHAVTLSAAQRLAGSTAPASSSMNGSFWISVASSHYHVWLKDGILAQNHRLHSAMIACERAFEYAENINNEQTWEMMISILLHAGNLGLALTTLDKMLSKFPMHPKLSSLVMYHSQCNFGLTNFEAASEMVKEVLSGPPKPYSDYDICLLLGRAYDKSSEKDESSNTILVENEEHELAMANRAKRRYDQAFVVAKRRNMVGDHEKAEGWLSESNTWRSLAEKCNVAGHFVFAVDCYQQALESSRRSQEDGTLWFSLAKALFRIGNADDAMIAAKHALDMDENNKQVEMAVKAWAERVSLAEEAESEDKTIGSILERVERNLGKAERRKTVVPPQPAPPVPVPNPTPPPPLLTPEAASPELAQPALPDDALSAPAQEQASESDKQQSSPEPQHRPIDPFTTQVSDDMTFASFQSFGTRMSKRSNATRIKAVVMSQLAKTLDERKMMRNNLRVAARLKEESTFANIAQQVIVEKLPLWKQKHREMERKKKIKENLWRQPLKQASVVRAMKKQTSDRTFKPSFTSMSHVFRQQSVMRFKKLGYPSGTAQTYQKHWMKKINHLVSGMVDEAELRRCLTEIRLHFPTISNDTAFVALAESRGSVEEACAKLNESGFVLETQLVASVIDLQLYVRGTEQEERERGREREREGRPSTAVIGGDLVDFENSLDSMSLLSSSIGPTTSFSSPPGSSESQSRLAVSLPRVPSPVFDRQPIARVATADGTRRTRQGQSDYMTALSDPATKSSKLSPVDFMVEQFSSENRVNPRISIKKGSVIKSSNWAIEEKNRICYNRKTNKLMKMESLRVEIMSGSRVGKEGMFSPLKSQARLGPVL